MGANQFGAIMVLRLIHATLPEQFSLAIFLFLIYSTFIALFTSQAHCTILVNLDFSALCAILAVLTLLAHFFKENQKNESQVAKTKTRSIDNRQDPLIFIAQTLISLTLFIHLSWW